MIQDPNFEKEPTPLRYNEKSSPIEGEGEEGGTTEHSFEFDENHEVTIKQELHPTTWDENYSEVSIILKNKDGSEFNFNSLLPENVSIVMDSLKHNQNREEGVTMSDDYGFYYFYEHPTRSYSSQRAHYSRNDASHPSYVYMERIKEPRDLLILLHEIGHSHDVPLSEALKGKEIDRRDVANEETGEEGVIMKFRKIDLLKETLRRERFAWTRALRSIRYLKTKSNINLLSSFTDYEDFLKWQRGPLSTYEQKAIEDAILIHKFDEDNDLELADLIQELKLTPETRENIDQIILDKQIELDLRGLNEYFTSVIDELHVFSDPTIKNYSKKKLLGLMDYIATVNKDGWSQQQAESLLYQLELVRADIIGPLSEYDPKSEVFTEELSYGKKIKKDYEQYNNAQRSLEQISGVTADQMNTRRTLQKGFSSLEFYGMIIKDNKSMDETLIDELKEERRTNLLYFLDIITREFEGLDQKTQHYIYRRLNENRVSEIVQQESDLDLTELFEQVNQLVLNNEKK